jgi:hypothetical protein
MEKLIGKKHRGSKMAISTFEGIVENGQIRLRDEVKLPEHAKVYVVIPDLELKHPMRIDSPRLVHREQAEKFTMEVLEAPADAKLSSRSRRHGSKRRIGGNNQIDARTCDLRR